MPAATCEMARPVRPRDMIFSFDTTPEPMARPGLSDTPRRRATSTPGRVDSGGSHRRSSVPDRATNGSRSPNQDGLT